MKFITKRKFYEMNTVLDFGRYAGKTMSYVLRFDPHWILWAVGNIEWFDVDTILLDTAIIKANELHKIFYDEMDDPYEYSY